MYAFLPASWRDGISLAEEGCLAGVVQVDRLSGVASGGDAMMGMLAWSSLDVGAVDAALNPMRQIRRESRRCVVRMVTHTPFPRAHAGESERVGFTRDVSALGICVASGHSEPAGSLLRVVVYDLDGRPERDAIARVMRCQQDGRGGVLLGLAIVDPARELAPIHKPHLRAVRHGERKGRRAIA